MDKAIAIITCIIVIGLLNIQVGIFAGVVVLLCSAIAQPQPQKPKNPYSPHEPPKV